MNAVGDLQKFIQILGDDENGYAACGNIEEFLPNSRGSAHVHPPGGLRYDQHLGAELNLSPDDELL